MGDREDYAIHLRSLVAKIGMIRSVLGADFEASLGMTEAQRCLIGMARSSARAPGTESEVDLSDIETLRNFVDKTADKIDDLYAEILPGASLHSSFAYEAEAEAAKALEVWKKAVGSRNSRHTNAGAYLEELKKFLRVSARLIDKDLQELKWTPKSPAQGA